MAVQTFRQAPLRVRTAGRVAAAAALMIAAHLNPAVAQTPPADFDGANATFFISANSMLRYGDSLLSKHYMTGRCTVFVCPVSFNGIDLFARRSRLKLDGGAGSGGTPGYGGGPVRPGTGTPAPSPYAGGTPGKGCVGITRTLRRGDESNEVKILQEILIKAGFQDVTADGRYGRKTEAAVSQFQRRTNIKADGTVGPKTLAFLPC